MVSLSSINSFDNQLSNAAQNINDDFSSITESCFSQQDQMTMNVQMSMIMKKTLQSPPQTYTDYIFLKSISTFLNSIAASNPCIYNIILYLDGYDSFLSSEKPLVTLTSKSDIEWYNYYSQIEASQKTLALLRTIPADNNSRKMDVITLFKKLSYLDGVLIANLPITNLCQLISNDIPLTSAQFYLLNSNNTLVIQNPSDNNYENCYQYLCSSFPENTIGNCSWIVIDNKLYRVFSDIIPSFDLKYSILLPVSTIITDILISLIWPSLMLVAIFMLVMIMAYTNTKENFNQIQYVINLFADAEKGIYPAKTASSLPQNEYELIMNNVIRLFLNTTFLNTQLVEQRYERKTAELEALQLQINPHFMVNTLQTVNFELFKITQGPSAIGTILNNLSDILNYALARENKAVTLKDELTNIHKYVDIQKFRFPNSFIYYEDIDEISEEQEFKRLLLQPLIENCISHGIRPLNRMGLIKVRIYTRDHIMHVSVIDNGYGIPKDKLKTIYSQLQDDSSTRIGLTNVNKRLVLSYGEASALKILSKEGYGTVITFHIPLQDSTCTDSNMK